MSRAGKLFGVLLSQQARKRSAPHVLTFEKFEDRKLLAGVVFNQGVVTVRGDATADDIALVGHADYQGFTVNINDDAALTRSFTYAEVDRLIVLAGDGNDNVTNTLLMDTDIRGENGNDRLEGGYRNDRLYGGSGNDTLIAKNGDDYLSGQDGNDFFYGNVGTNTLDRRPVIVTPPKQFFSYSL